MEHNNASNDWDYEFKIVLTADQVSGKTWFLKRFVNEPLSDEYRPTAEPYSTERTIIDKQSKKKINIKLWDTISENSKFDNEKRYLPLRGADGILLLLDVTNHESIIYISRWFDDYAKYTSNTTKLLIVATKCDEVERRVVTNEEILNVIREWSQFPDYKDRDIHFIETSAKNDYNITEAMHMITASILKQVLEPDQELNQINDSSKDKNKAEKKDKDCIIM